MARQRSPETRWNVEAKEIGWDLLDFPVEKRKLYYQDGRSRVEIPDRKAVVRTDTGTTLQVVSDDYQLVPHRKAFEPISEAISRLKNPVEGIQTSVGLGGAYARLTWTFDVGEKVRKEDDIVKLRLIAHNSMNYKSDLSVRLGALRLLCSNGLVVAAGPQYRVGGKHFRNLDVDYIMGELQKMLKNDTFPMIKNWREWAQQKVSVEHVEHWFERSANPQLIGKKAAEEILNHFGQQEGNLWEAYNAITWFATHKVPTSTRRSVTRIAVTQDRLQHEALRLVRAMRN